MAKDDRSRENQSDDWKEKMGMELSGLEHPRDFLIAVAFFIGFLAIAAVIAFIAFG